MLKKSKFIFIDKRKFVYQDSNYKAHSSSTIKNPYLEELGQEHENYTIFFVFENSVIFKKDNEILRFSDIQGYMGDIKFNSQILEKK